VIGRDQRSACSSADTANPVPFYHSAEVPSAVKQWGGILHSYRPFGGSTSKPPASIPSSRRGISIGVGTMLSPAGIGERLAGVLLEADLLLK
jgi:hypothetical protein